MLKGKQPILSHVYFSQGKQPMYPSHIYFFEGIQLRGNCPELNLKLLQLHTYIVVFLHTYKHTHIHTYLCTKRQGDLQHGLHSYVHNVCRWIHVSELNFKCPVVHTSLSAACSLQDRCDSNSCWASLKCPRLSHAHTYIHTHIHTYICTCTHTYVHPPYIHNATWASLGL